MKAMDTTLFGYREGFHEVFRGECSGGNRSVGGEGHTLLLVAVIVTSAPYTQQSTEQSCSGSRRPSLTTGSPWSSTALPILDVNSTYPSQLCARLSNVAFGDGQAKNIRNKKRTVRRGCSTQSCRHMHATSCTLSYTRTTASHVTPTTCPARGGCSTQSCKHMRLEAPCCHRHEQQPRGSLRHRATKKSKRMSKTAFA